jgi:hypothetical protein
VGRGKAHIREVLAALGGSVEGLGSANDGSAPDPSLKSRLGEYTRLARARRAPAATVIELVPAAPRPHHRVAVAREAQALARKLAQAARTGAQLERPVRSADEPAPEEDVSADVTARVLEWSDTPGRDDLT